MPSYVAFHCKNNVKKVKFTHILHVTINAEEKFADKNFHQVAKLKNFLDQKDYSCKPPLSISTTRWSAW